MTSALHSSHVCLGGWDGGADALGRADLGSVDAPWARLVRNQKERTCLFRNVCFDGAREGWVYFARGNEFQHAKRVRAAVDVWARGDFAQMGEISEDHSFALTHAALPASAEWQRVGERQSRPLYSTPVTTGVHPVHAIRATYWTSTGSTAAGLVPINPSPA